MSSRIIPEPSASPIKDSVSNANPHSTLNAAPNAGHHTNPSASPNSSQRSTNPSGDLAMPQQNQEVQQQNQHIQASYDEVIYHSQIVRLGDPEKACVLARLMGVPAPDPRQARILELACGTGANLLNIAQRFPQAHCVGIDLAPRQIAIAQGLAQELAIPNVEFITQSILDVQPDFGSFDYIIAHGVYSWVPQEVQDKILAICRANLSPHGVAMVSYNVRPGWAMRGLIRDMMLFQAEPFNEPERKITEARGILQFLAELDWSPENPYGSFLKKELQLVGSHPDHYIYHEFLESNNEPLYFYQFNQRLQRADLQYLGEPSYNEMMLDTLPPKARELLQQANDRIRLEQYMDFVRYRQFRHTLIVQKEAALQSATADRLASMWVGAQVHAKQLVRLDKTPVVYSVPGVGMDMTLAHPLYKAAFQILRQQWPAFLPYSELSAQAAQSCQEQGIAVTATDMQGLGDTLLRAALLGIVNLLVGPPSWSTALPPHPRLHALARWALQNSKGTELPTLKHHFYNPSAPVRSWLELVDGSRTVVELKTVYAEQMLLQQAVDPALPKKSRAECLAEAENLLTEILQQGLLVRPAE